MIFVTGIFDEDAFTYFWDYDNNGLDSRSFASIRFLTSAPEGPQSLMRVAVLSFQRHFL